MTRPYRVEACLCGGEIGAYVDDECDVAEAVREHQASLQHKRWRSAQSDEPRHVFDVFDGYERRPAA
jgi:hypothetical protein